MKRDMDLVRKILLACEASPTSYAPEVIEIDGYDHDQIAYHIGLAVQAGLMTGIDRTHLGSDTDEWIASGLTWDGHEFIEQSRDESIWEKAKKAATAGAGGLSFAILKAALGAFGTAELMKHVPIK